MANNIQALIDLLADSVLNVDLSFINSREIVKGDLQHIGQFLQVILEFIVQMAQDQGEGEEEEEMEEIVSQKKHDSPVKEPKPGSAKKPKIEELPDFYGESQPESKQVMVDDDDEDEPKIEDEDPFDGDQDAHFQPPNKMKGPDKTD